MQMAFNKKNLQLGVLLFLIIASILALFLARQRQDISSSAASITSHEVENGTIENAVTMVDETASNGKYVQFMANSTSAQQVTLLNSYYLDPRINGSYYQRMRYSPRQFTIGAVTTDFNTRVDSVGKYNGWDMLNTPNYSQARLFNSNDFVKLRLNRPAQVAVVWQNGTTNFPDWLKSWTLGENVTLAGKSYPTYTKNAPAGDLVLGAIYDSSALPKPFTTTPGRTYLILLAEQDGKPSLEPSAPTGLALPKPNETCPAWLHDSFKVKGPDGKEYATWHPQIDRVYWCYYRHEHGSDPELAIAGYKPPYNYVPTKLDHNHGGEGHTGFKSYHLDIGGKTYYITQHFGTGSINRYCNRFHSFDMLVKDNATGEILADLHLMGDFGKAVANTTGEVMRPLACPTQGNGIGGRVDGFGERRQPVDDHKSPDSGNTPFYEAWSMGKWDGALLGFKQADFHINTGDAMIICDTLVCEHPLTVPNQYGSDRTFADLVNVKFQAGTHTGEFYTDAYAKKIVSKDDPLAVRQYVKPGLSFALPSGMKCKDTLAWGQKYLCADTNTINSGFGETVREKSILLPN